VSLITKSALIERDLDLLAPMARRVWPTFTLSNTTLDHEISRRMNRETSAPARRLLAVRTPFGRGHSCERERRPCHFPFLTDSELEASWEASGEECALSTAYVWCGWPWEVRPIFKDWLEKHFPLKAAHVMSRYP
jgi:DNA repair photolyase